MVFTRNTLSAAATTPPLKKKSKSHLHHCLNSLFHLKKKKKKERKKKHFFHRKLCGLFGSFLHSFFCLGQSFHRENRKARTFNPPLSLLPLYFFIISPFLSLSLLSLFSLLCLVTRLSQSLLFILKPSPFLVFPSHLFLFISGVFLGLCGFVLFCFVSERSDMLRKKMKGVVVASKGKAPAFPPLCDDPRARFKHQSLMQDYQQLLKETEVMKNKFQMMKQKKFTLQSEVRFLRRRHQYLTANQPSTSIVDRNSVKDKHTQIQSKKVAKEKTCSRKAVGLSRPALGFDLSKKGRNYNEKEVTLRKSIPGFDLNQKLKTYHGKASTLQNSMPFRDLNQKDRVYSQKEVAVQNTTPTFDLNQISREEEELQFNSETWRVEESKKGSIRGGSDEQLNDMKLSVCRNIGNGTNRGGKRKISWQDQVALRV